MGIDMNVELEQRAQLERRNLHDLVLYYKERMGWVEKRRELERELSSIKALVCWMYQDFELARPEHVAGCTCTTCRYFAQIDAILKELGVKLAIEDARAKIRRWS